MVKAYIFDLDGTLADTLSDLAYAVNYALLKTGYSERSIDEVKSFVGNGIRNLIKRCIGKENETDTDRVLEAFKDYYSKNCTVYTRVYDGINELLHHLKANGMKLGVVSNKADFGVKKIVEHYFPSVFDSYYGQIEGVPLKPDRRALDRALEELKVDKREVLYVGDSDVDITFANNCEVGLISVGWGFRDKEFLIEKGAGFVYMSPEEIIKTSSF